jgi:hypothetical protein
MAAEAAPPPGFPNPKQKFVVTDRRSQIDRGRAKTQRIFANDRAEQNFS